MSNAAAANPAPVVGGREISLQGWDTASVMPCDVVNASIKANKTTPPTFQQSDSFSGSISGAWGLWQMVPDKTASGGGIKMVCPIVSGNGIDARGQPNDLAGAVVYVTLTLANQDTTLPVVPDPKKTAANPDPTAKTQILVADPKPSATSSSAVVDLVTPKPISQRFLSLFQDWFDANIGNFGQVFFAAEINSKAAKDKFQWLRPTTLSYASATTLANVGYFGALCQTLGHDASQNAQQFDVGIAENLPAGTNSVLAISGESFTRQVLVPGASAIFAGSDPLKDFSVDKTGLIVTNTNGLTWQHFKLDDGNTVTATIPAGNFSMQVIGDQIEVQFTGVTWQHPLMVGNDVFSLDFTQRIHMALGKNAAGELVLVTTNKDPSVPGATEAPDLRNCVVSVTPDATATDFDTVMNIVGMVTAVIGIGIFTAGKWAVNAANTAAAASELRTALSAGNAVLDVAIDGSQAARSMSTAQVFEGNLAAAEAFANQGAPLSAQGALYLSRFGALVGVIGAVTTIAGNINKLIVLADGSIDTNKVPALDEFLDNVLGASAWPDVTGWELKDIELAQSLLLYGDAKF